MQQLPGEAQRSRYLAGDADLALHSWLQGLQAPCLEHAHCPGAAKYLVIQPLAQCREQCFDLLASLKKLLVGPLPVLREIPAYLFALLRCERVRQQVTLVPEPQLVTAQFYAGNSLRWRADGRWCERD